MYLLLDIGRSKIRIATSQDLIVFSDPLIFDTPQNSDQGLNFLFEKTRELLAGAKLDGIAFGISRMLWPHVSVSDFLQDKFSCPVFSVNDSALVALGEAKAGAGRSSKVFAYITISSGVGGARIVDGKIDESVFGFEPGHQIINFDDGLECLSCGKRGHLEGYISGLAIQERMGVPPYEIKDNDFWNQIAKTLSIGLHNVIMHWSPDMICLGGSMTKVPGIKIEDVERHLSEISTIFPSLPTIKKAELGDIGGIYGAKELLRQNLV